MDEYSDSHEQKRWKLSEKFPFIETVEVGNLTVVALPIDHHQRPSRTILPDGSKLESKLPELYKHIDGVVFEYHPAELIRLRTLARFVGYAKPLASRLNYFLPFLLQARREEKETYALDPAYSPAWETTTALLIGLSGLTCASAAMIERSLKLPPIVSLVTLGLFSAQVVPGLVELVSGIPMATSLNFQDRRRAIVAQGLVQMGNSVEHQGKNILVLYGPTHWAGIKKLLFDEELRRRNFAFSSSMFRGPFYDHFCSIRKYVVDCAGKFVSVENVPIE